jgi:signal transduction histidine kinase
LCASKPDSRSIQSNRKKAATKRKNCELPDQNTKLLALAEQVAHFGSWEWDVTKPRAIWSPEMFRIFGIEPKVEGLTLQEYRGFIHPDDVAELSKRMENSMFNVKVNQKTEVDYRIIRPDGSIRTIHSQRMMKEVAKDGRLKVIVGVDQDVTEQRLAEEKVQQYSRHLEELVEKRTRQLKETERLAAIGATAGMVGHDIRNPLQALAGDVFLIKTELAAVPNNEAKQSINESLDCIEQGIMYINKIVADLQDYSRPLNPEFQEAALANLISDVIKTIVIPENIKLYLKIQSLPIISLELTFTRRALTNLINNAIQAMPNGGQLEIAAYQEKDFISIKVADTGVGIPDEVKPKLFTPMFTTKAKGQGLGLAVVKRLIEAQGGNISFESKVGTGTTFLVKLPISRT